jgi:hypothetical protein
MYESDENDVVENDLDDDDFWISPVWLLKVKESKKKLILTWKISFIENSW